MPAKRPKPKWGHRAKGMLEDLGKERWCQANANQSPKSAKVDFSGRHLTPLSQGSGSVFLEDIAAIEVTFLIEMIMDRGMDGNEFLQGFDVPELRHCAFSSSERLV